ncbi:MAG: hypothetical protein ACE5IO_09665 [Thermoplasmata archaeon]
MKRYMVFFAAFGLAILLIVALFSPQSGIRFLLYLLISYLVALLVIFLGIRSNRFIPWKYGISRERLYLQYKKKLETYRWNEISRIHSQRTQGSTKLVIESVDGVVTPIAFLLKDERERIFDYYENLNRLNEPE